MSVVTSTVHTSPMLRIIGVSELILGIIVSGIGGFYLSASVLIDRGPFDDSMAGVDGVVLSGIGIGLAIGALGLMRLQKYWLPAHIPLVVFGSRSCGKKDSYKLCRMDQTAACIAFPSN